MALRSKRKLAGMDRRGPYDVWRERVQSETEDDRREALIEFGIAEGWVGPDGEVLDPNATGADRLNADIRRAWRGG